MKWSALALATTACAAAAQPTSGSSLPLRLAPAEPPRFEGAYDFDLLGPVQGKACVNRDGPIYWMNNADIERVTSDELSRRAISAAALEAVGSLERADAIVLTRAWADASGPDRVCATVYGRGVRLKKAEPPAPEEHGEPPKTEAPGNEDVPGAP